jgi:hypothetical protein
LKPMFWSCDRRISTIAELRGVPADCMSVPPIECGSASPDRKQDRETSRRRPEDLARQAYAHCDRIRCERSCQPNAMRYQRLEIIQCSSATLCLLGNNSVIIRKSMAKRDCEAAPVLQSLREDGGAEGCACGAPVHTGRGSLP